MQPSSPRLPSRARRARKPRKLRPHLEVLETRVVMDVRSITGAGNNLANPTWGAAGTDLLRVSPVAYADGISTPSLPGNPSARAVSDAVNVQAAPGDPTQDLATIDQNSLSDFGYVWGQFIDHDMDLTPSGSGEFFNIPADPNDPSQMGTQTFERSSFDPNTGTSPGNPRQQVNAITSYLDLSNVYGSTITVANALRTFSGGRLKTSPGNMLPYNSLTYFTQSQLNALNMANDSGAVPSTSLFAAGDVRANENVELTALQTLFVRNHNLLAGELQQEHPAWGDEQLYQEARKLNIAEEEFITYNQYLPDVLGPGALPAYQGYKAGVNAGIATEFSTVGFRFGHSLLSGAIERHGNNGQDIPGDPTGDASLSLATDFFDPNVLNPNGVIDPLTGHISTDIDAILKGDADGDSNATDVLAINEVRNLLFANGGLQDNGQDLIARDIQRARDDGIGTYNQVRVAYGLAPVTGFAQITSNVQVQQELQAAYGTVDNIDPFEGGLAEDHAPGSDMGPLFTRILATQFARLRDGDRFFYLNENFNFDEQNLLQQGNTLAKVIEANTHITNLQADVMQFKASVSGTVFFDVNGNGVRSSSDPPLTGFAVQLLNGDGAVVATTTTDINGNYTFTQLSGPAANPENGSGVSATGQYSVVLTLPSGWAQNATQAAADPGTVTLTRGGVNVTGQNFAVSRSSLNFGGGFASPSPLQLNGSAKINGSALELTDGAGGEAGSAFTTSVVSVAKFTTTFRFHLSAPNADGFTFTVQGVGPTALGSSGGGLGYGTDGVNPGPVIGTSVAVKFDLYNNSGEGINSTGLYLNGASPTNLGSVNLSGTGIDLHSGDVFSVNLAYNGKTLTETITDTLTGASFTTSYAVNIAGVLGGGNGFVGFTGGTGGLTATQDILSWTYSPVTVSPNFAGGFASTSGLQLNGSARVSGSRLRLTDGAGGEAASAFTTSSVDASQFATSFTFQLTNPGADGITFTLQANDPSQLGAGGGGLGFQGIPNSVAVKFDLYNNSGEGVNSTGLYLNGAAPTGAGSVDLTGSGIDLHSGDVFSVSLSYDGSTLTEVITDTATGASFTHTYSVNIVSVLGRSTAFVGFTAGTGGLTATQDILAWNYTALA